MALDDDAFMIQVLQWQSDRFEREMRAKMTKLHQLEVWSFSLLAVFGTATLHERIYGAAIAMPILVSAVSYIAVGLLDEAMALSAARDHLDEQIAHGTQGLRLGKLVGWGESGGAMMVWSLPNLGVLVTYVVATVATSVASFAIAWSHYPREASLMVSVIIVESILLLGVVPSGVSANRRYAKVRRALMELDVEA